MLSTVETVDTHLDRAHAALQYLDQGLRSSKCAEQISAVYTIEKVVQTYGSIIVILDAVWLKVVDFGLKWYGLSPLSVSVPFSS